MKKKLWLLAFALILCIAALTLSAFAAGDTSTLTLKAVDSGGAPLEGVAFSASGGQFGGSITKLGTSDADGKLVKDLKHGQYNIIAGYNFTTEKRSNISLSADGITVTFTTTEAKVKVQNSSGTPLANISLSYNAQNSYPTFGKTNENGIATKELFAGTYGIQASYMGTRSGYIHVNIIESGIDYTFKTTKVNFNYPKRVDYLGKDSSYYKLSDANQAGEMFPGTYKFFFGGSVKPDFTKTIEITENGNIALIIFKDSSGKGLESGKVSYYAGGWIYTDTYTDSDGFAVLSVPQGINITSVALDYKGGRVQTNQKAKDNPLYIFNTVPVEVNLLNSIGAELDGGRLQYYGLAATKNAVGGWLDFGTDGKPNAKMELLPMAYSFQVTYQGAKQTQTKVDIRTNPLITFKTVRVTVEPGAYNNVTYYTTKWYTYTDPVELLPVPTTFSFKGTGLTNISKKITPETGVTVTPQP